MLQSARFRGCDRSEPEMRGVWQFAFGCEDYHFYMIRMIEPPQQHFSIEYVFLGKYVISNHILIELYVVYMFVY